MRIQYLCCFVSRGNYRGQKPYQRAVRTTTKKPTTKKPTTKKPAPATRDNASCGLNASFVVSAASVIFAVYASQVFC